MEDDAALLVCEGGDLKIFCGKGQTIVIVAAVYGRNKDFDKCPTMKQPVGECSAVSSLSVARTKCQGKESCNLRVSSEIFGDPCYGVSKYLEVWFEMSVCLSKKATTVVMVLEK